MTPITPMSPGFRLFGSNGSGKGKARAESQAVVDQQQTEKGQAMVVEQTLQVQSMVEQEPIQESAPQVEDSQSIKTAAPSDSEKNELSRTSSIASSIQSISASVADYVRSSLSSVASSRSSDGSTSTDQQQGPYTQSTYTRVRLRRQEASAPTQVVEADPFADPLNAPEPATVPSSSPDKIKPINDADKGDVEKDHLRTDKPAFDGSLFPDYAPLVQSRVTVGRWGLILAIGSFNLALVILFLFLAPTGASLVVMVALKARDILSVLWQTLLFLLALVSQPFLTKKPMVVHPPRKIVSLVPVYKESTQDVLDTVDSIINDNPVRTQDFNIIAILADGFDVEDDVIVTDTIARVDDFPYFSWKIRESAFRLHFGYRRGCPIMIVRKVKNAGKKDSLIFAFDLFNSDNEATGHCNSEAREMVLEHIRRLYDQPELEWFHFVFCTDADTKILAGSVNVLADRLMDEGPETVGACGIVEADFEKPGRSLRTCGLWYFWDHFQGFQYTYGQWIRRRSESSWGRVTCMPGAITMLRTGTILGQASAEYRKHVQNGNLVKRQVQYQGTDRRLCWSIISRSKSVRTVLETRAACFTIPPQSLSHYLSQRRRWGSNAYFNAFITLTGPNQHLVTRAWMTLELARSSLVFFRMYNFGHFVYNLVTKFSLIGVAPLLAITLLPQIWFFFCVVLPTKRYRGLWHHLLYGAVLNRACSVVLTPTVYANVLLGFGDFRWGKSHTGANAATQQPAGDDKAVDAMEKGESRPETPPKEYSEVC
uniref:chitin synthase n=2 Tax=Kalmanozyma brasiliensis (strain GHG001) TaxID=1365824 RepID=V5GN58_KALBG